MTTVSRKHPHLPGQVPQGLVVLSLRDGSTFQEQIQGVLLIEEELSIFSVYQPAKKSFPREEVGIDRFHSPILRADIMKDLHYNPYFLRRTSLRELHRSATKVASSVSHYL